MNIVSTFFKILTKRERYLLYLLFCAVVVMAGLEVASVASIMPFLSVAADPSAVHENAYLSWTFETFGFTDTRTFLMTLGLGALLALGLSNVFIVATTWALYRYAWGRNHALSRRLLRSYLHRPYEYFLTRNSSELGKNILEEVKEIVGQMLIPGLRGLSKGIVSVFIVSFLIYIDPRVALIASGILGSAYTVIYYIVKNKLHKLGTKRVDENTRRYQFVREAFGGIKEVKLRGKEDVFIDQYSEPSELYSKYQAEYRLIKTAPRYILEVVSFGGIIAISIYLIGVKSDISNVIPMLGLYAFAGYRLMPALQSLFKGIASLRFNSEALKVINRGIKEQNIKNNHDSLSKKESINKVDFEKKVSIKNVTYKYPGEDNFAIKDISLEVPKNSTIGIFGKTGSGKTTLVDIIIGVINPEKGNIVVDGKKLDHQQIGRWQKNIGYVPQKIYLSDDTVARNIAFGVPRGEIDMESVVDAARRAQICDFVEEELKERWDTVVGEQGVKLSGGQRQRIGIARALYHRPSVFVFDEATSALDQSTEASVMDSIYDLSEDHTMIMIAHRLSTLKRADRVIMLETGRKIGEGTYHEIIEQNSSFQTIVPS